MLEKLKITTKHTEIREYSIELTGEEIVNMLAERGIPMGSSPALVDVIFSIPSGADWSGEDVGIDFCNPIRIRWKLKEDGDVDTSYG